MGFNSTEATVPVRSGKMTGDLSRLVCKGRVLVNSTSIAVSGSAARPQKRETTPIVDEVAVKASESESQKLLSGALS